MNRLGLSVAFVHGQDQAAVHEFLIHVRRCGRKEDHDRAFYFVIFGREPSGCGVFACAGDGELAFALKKL